VGRSAAAHDRRALVVLAVIALLVRQVIAVALPNMLWPDEIFQTLEPAHRLAFGYGIVSWEFRTGARSWLFPGFLAGIMRVTEWMGPGSTGYLTGITLALCALSLVPVVVAFKWARRSGAGVGPALAAGIACGAWFELLFFAPKALNEVAAAHLLVAGLYLASTGERLARRGVAAGALLGLASALRFHLAPAIVVGAALAVGRDRRAWRYLALGAAPIFVLAGVLDAVTWSYPFESFVRSVWVNVIEGKAAKFGVLPAHAYVVMMLRTWSWAALPMVALAAVGARRAPALLGTAAVVLAAHSAIGHKEYRFVYPTVVLIVVLAALGTAVVLTRLSARFSVGLSRVGVVAAAAAWITASAALGSDFRAAATLQSKAPTGWSHWRSLRSSLEVFEQLSTDPDVCGIGLYWIGWGNTGGYSYLHRDVPIYDNWNETEYARRARAFNVTLASFPPSMEPVSGLDPKQATRCWGDGVCLFRREGRCDPIPGYDINEKISAWEQ
jgi:hypothetical protein